MDERAAALHLDRLRKHRNRKPADLGIRIDEQIVHLKRARGRSSRGQQAAIDLLPERLRPLIASVRVGRGMVRIGVRDDGARYTIDRWFRGTAREDVLARLGAGDVRVEVEPDCS